MRINKTKKFIVPYMIRVAENRMKKEYFNFTGFGTFYVKARIYQCIGRSTKGRRRLN